MSGSPGKGPGTHGLAGEMELGQGGTCGTALPEQLGSPLPRKLFPRGGTSKAESRMEGRSRTSRAKPSLSVPSRCLVTVFASPHTTASAGSMPTPGEAGIRAHLVTEPETQGGQAQWGGGLCEVGSGLLCPLEPHLTTSQGTGTMGESRSTSPTILQPAKHRACPCMAPTVSKQPGPGPRGPCRHQLGPAEGPW